MVVTTQNKGLEQQPHNNLNWDTPNNANFDIIDAALGGLTLINVTAVGTGPTALTQAQYKNMCLSFSGVLSNNVNYQLPNLVQGQWFIKNNTTGAFNLVISSGGGGSSVTLAQGVNYSLYCDGTGVTYMNVVGSFAKAVTDWDQASLYRNTYLSGDVATSLLPTGYEGQTGGVGRAGVGVYYSADATNGVCVVHAYPGNNRWQRMYIAGVWSTWTKLPNYNEVVRRDFRLTGNANTAVSGATVPGADFYLIDTGSTNIPTWASVGDMLLSYNQDNSNGTQLVMSRTGKAAIRGVLANVWSSWTDVQNFARFESAQTAYTNDSSGSIAHGLGAVPRNLGGYLVCLTAQGGISVGDRLRVNTAFLQLRADATNIVYRVLNTGISSMGAGGTATVLTPANFRLVLTAEL